MFGKAAGLSFRACAISVMAILRDAQLPINRGKEADIWIVWNDGIMILYHSINEIMSPKPNIGLPKTSVPLFRFLRILM